MCRPDDRPTADCRPPTWVHGRLAEAARIMRAEQFTTRGSATGLPVLPVPGAAARPSRPAGRWSR